MGRIYAGDEISCRTLHTDTGVSAELFFIIFGRGVVRKFNIFRCKNGCLYKILRILLGGVVANRLKFE